MRLDLVENLSIIIVGSKNQLQVLLLIKSQVEDEVWLLGFSQMVSIWIYSTIEQLLQKKFVNFCQYSDVQLPKNKVNKIDDIIITIDNASWHTSEETKLHMKRLGFNVIYHPPYSPSLAPVELFFKLI